MQDDLAALFARQMTVESVLPQTISDRATPPPPDALCSAPTTASTPITYNITQHYHHSSHLALTGISTERSKITRDLQIEPGMAVDEILLRHNINPSSLYPSQHTLFQQADLDQKARLVELWQISPPNGGKPISPQEVEITSSQAEIPPPDTSNVTFHSPSGTQETDIMDQDDMTGVDANNVEPYVVSGYESLAQREYEQSATLDSDPSTDESYSRATDPVYKGHDWWQQFPAEQPMEHQYGAFELKNMYIGCGAMAPHLLESQSMF